MAKSPLTHGDDVTLIDCVPGEQLAADWQKAFGLDITGELRGHREVQLYECTDTGLRFFEPANVAGGSAFYAHLEQHDWYYMPRKWEHDAALADLRGCTRVLEVGCGRGAFVRRLIRERGLRAEGLELNAQATAEARRQGLPVSGTDVYELATQRPGEFDAVCAFEVLEHVADARRFLEALLRLLRPAGRLILAVPDQDSFMGLARGNVLDRPPHHMTRWRECVFRQLPNLFPLRLVRFAHEPLQAYHVNWYVNTNTARANGGTIGGRAKTWMIRQVAKPLLQRSSWARRCIRGHTLYVCYEKR